MDLAGAMFRCSAYFLSRHSNMPRSESAPLLEGQASESRDPKFNPLHSSKHLLLSSWINLLLVFIPLSFLGDFRAAGGHS